MPLVAGLVPAVAADRYGSGFRFLKSGFGLWDVFDVGEVLGRFALEIDSWR
jgi:hypothetical protein